MVMAKAEKKKRQSTAYPQVIKQTPRHGNRQYRAVSFLNRDLFGNLDNLYHGYRASGPLVLHFHVAPTVTG